MLRAVETGLSTNRARPMGSASRSPRFRKASSSTPAARISCKAAFIIRISLREAMKLAEEAELDLVKIAPKATPPVCKIIDYGKYRYELARKEKEAKKKQKTVEVKEIRLSPNIETNDLNTKMNAARKFLSKGNKVKVTLRFRGREMAHMQSSKHILTDIAEALEDVAVVEKAPKIEGRSISMVLAEKR